MRATRTIAAIGALGCVAIALALFFTATRSRHAEATHAIAADLHGTPLVPPKPARDFVLHDGDGRATHLVDRRFAITMIFFGYTHCPDACPLALASLGRAYRTLAPAARARTRIVFVTVDPARDSSAVVRAYARNFDPHVVALTGSADELAPVWSAYDVRVDAKTREIGHGDAISAVDANGRIAYVYPPDVPASDLAADLATLAR